MLIRSFYIVNSVWPNPIELVGSKFIILKNKIKWKYKKSTIKSGTKDLVDWFVIKLSSLIIKLMR